MPSTMASFVPSSMWHTAGAHDDTMLPGSVTVHAGTDTCASTLATATAVPGFSPVSCGHRRRQAAGAAAPMGVEVARHLLVDHMFQARVERLEEFLGREALALRPDGLVAGGAGVARLHAGQLPDHPVRGFEQPVGRGVDIRGFVQDLQRLGKEPLRGDLAAVARQPRLAALSRQSR